MDDIDKLTMELFMNKKQYRKYLAKTDPLKSKEYEEYLENRRQHADSIMELTMDLLENPSLQITTEINEIFEHYVKTLIHYFQRKEMEERPGEEDENVLFGESAFENRATAFRKKSQAWYKEEEPVNEMISESSVKSQSFWGKDIYKAK